MEAEQSLQDFPLQPTFSLQCFPQIRPLFSIFLVALAHFHGFLLMGMEYISLLCFPKDSPTAHGPKGKRAVPDGFAVRQYSSLCKPSFWQLMRNMPRPGRGAFINRAALATWNQGIRWTLPGCQKGCACGQHHPGFDIHKDFTYFSKNNSFKRPMVNIEEEEAKRKWKYAWFQ